MAASTNRPSHRSQDGQGKPDHEHYRPAGQGTSVLSRGRLKQEPRLRTRYGERLSENGEVVGGITSEWAPKSPPRWDGIINNHRRGASISHIGVLALNFPTTSRQGSSLCAVGPPEVQQEGARTYGRGPKRSSHYSLTYQPDSPKSSDRLVYTRAGVWIVWW